jgi:hypothetical protein
VDPYGNRIYLYFFLLTVVFAIFDLSFHLKLRVITKLKGIMTTILSILFICIPAMIFFYNSRGNDFIIPDWYRDCLKKTNRACWADTVRLNANYLEQSGFKGIWLLPLVAIITVNQPQD